MIPDCRSVCMLCLLCTLAMRVLRPAAIPLATGSLILACMSRNSEGFSRCPLNTPPFQTRSSRLSLVPQHSPLNMFQPLVPTSTDAQAPPLTSHRDRKEIKGRGNPSVTAFLPSYRWLSGSARRRTHTTLREKPGPGAQGPGTQQLSRQAKLAISVLIDLIGASSYTVPGLGELSDVGWAPVSSALIFYLYGNSIFAGLAFVEEILPGLDFIPTATIAWFLTNSEVGKNVANAASGKAEGPDTSKASSDWSRSSTPSSGPSGKGETTKHDRDRRGLDPNLIKSGVIDVDGD